jgi:hypothetical protein
MAKKTDLQRAYEGLKAKSKTYKTLLEYYGGDQPLKYSAERLKEAFKLSTVKFTQNWCAVVLDAVLDRLVFKGWDPKDKQANVDIDQFYTRNNIQKISDDVHKNALATGEGFIVFDKVDNFDRAFFNDSRLVQVFYDPNNPEKKLFAAKWWKDDIEEITRLNLYYSDRIEKYATKESILVSQSSFKMQGDPVDNPYEEIPVIHFNLGYSELANITTLQDAINKLLSDMMVVGEFNAFKQRWAVTNSDMSKLKSSPQSFFQFPKGAADEENTQVGEFEEANLDMFLSAMDKLASSISVISRTPKHYFESTGANISGEALLVMESPLIKKVRQIQERFSVAWQDCGRFILEHGYGKSVDMSEIITVWDPVETVQPLLKAQEMEAMKRLGIPLKTILRRAGWGADEIEQYEKDAKEEKSNKVTETSLLLEQIRRKNQQENDQNERSGL